MKQELKFVKCSHCGNIAQVVEDKGPALVCCGTPMDLLNPNTEEAAHEKHIPVVTVDGANIKIAVGSVEHPMVEGHHIAWIVLETEQGYDLKYLNHTGAPEANFSVANGDKAIAAYAYCNLHGLWKAAI